MESTYIIVAVIVVLVVVGIIIYLASSSSSAKSDTKTDTKTDTKMFDQKVNDSATKTNTNQTGIMTMQSRQVGKLNIEGP